MTEDQTAGTARRDAAVPAFDPVAESRRLLRSIRAGTLATLDGDGRPFASLVNVATTPDGSPVLLLSRLAAHTRHLEVDGRCSLLLAQNGKGDPLAHPRLTVTGQATPDRDPSVRARFLRRHPKATLYADFGDFSFWRVAIDAAHINGGFAKAGGVGGADLLLSIAGAEALLASEGGALDHMNADHRDALALYARHFGKEADGPWRATGFDPEGMDLMAGDRTARVLFSERVADPGALRRCLVTLAAQARGALASKDPPH